MTSRLLAQVETLRTFMVVFATGEEPIEGLKRFAQENQIAGAQLMGVGAFERVTAAKEDAPAIHAHVALAKADGTAHGGHLLEATVRPTLEVIVTETPAYLQRKYDPATGLHLIAA